MSSRNDDLTADEIEVLHLEDDGSQGRPPACGHDPRRCCEKCCPDEESSNGRGGGCHTCRGHGLALPRAHEGMTGEQVATLIDAMLEEVHDPAVTDVLRFVLHVTRGDFCPAAYEEFLK